MHDQTVRAVDLQVVEHGTVARRSTQLLVMILESRYSQSLKALFVGGRREGLAYGFFTSSTHVP